jgi:hypothetical protein
MSKALCISFLLMTTISIGYHLRQNGKSVLGGNISVAKSFWLGYAFYHYFIYSFILYWFIFPSELKQLMLMITIWFYFRMLAQGVMMFVLKNWSPKYGISHNILSSILIFSCIIYQGINYSKYDSSEILMVLLFLFNLLLIAIVDTIYARKFFNIIGNRTKGDQAIWYASNDERYSQINMLTIRNNYFFVLYSLVLIVIVMLYDKF